MGIVADYGRAVRRTIVGACAACVWLSSTSIAVAQPGAPGAIVAGQRATDHIVVRATPRFYRDIEQSLPNHAQGVGAAARAAMSAGLDATSRRWGVTDIRPAFRFGFAHPELASKYGLDQLFVINTAPGTDTTSMAADFSNHSDEVAQASTSTIGGIGAIIPDDNDFDRQWGLHNTGTFPNGSRTCVADADIDAPSAWGVSTGDIVDPIVIAILDSGVEPHAEFAGRMVPGISTGDADETDTGDDCSIFHGTHVTGIAAASGDNAIGIAGVCWNCQIMPVDVLFDANHQFGGCSGSTLDLANGIIWAADHGADVMNISLQYYSLSTGDADLLHNAILYAHDLDIVIIAATGNNQGALVAYPALFPETVAVGGTTCQNRHALFGVSANWTSNSGPEIDVAAPGDQIWSCDENDGYQEISGTSMATPHASGVAALIRSVDPLLTNTEVEQVLRDTAVDIESPGWDELTGHGVVNAYAAMVVVADITPAIPAVSTWGLVTLALLGMIAGTCILLDPRAGHSKESAVE